jgi:hypothetical protein
MLTAATSRRGSEITMHALAFAQPRSTDSRAATTLGGILAPLWTAAPALTGSAAVLFALAIPFALGLWLDPRVITGAPAWLKPLKFAVSTGLYSLTLAWVFTHLPAWHRTRRVVGAATIAAMFIEVGLIAMQAARGTTSHFNTATPFDRAVFAVMGLVIATQTVISIAVAVALWRQRFADRALGWALRLGLVITILGASTGGLMVTPTAAQRAEIKATGVMRRSGAHTVGGVDGGPGLPVTGWSTQHGDVRVPHFVGLHAWQVLPMFVVLALGRFGERRRVQITIAAAAAYGLLFVALLVQALRGLPVIPLG